MRPNGRKQSVIRAEVKMVRETLARMRLQFPQTRAGRLAWLKAGQARFAKMYKNRGFRKHGSAVWPPEDVRPDKVGESYTAEEFMRRERLDPKARVKQFIDTDWPFEHELVYEMTLCRSSGVSLKGLRGLRRQGLLTEYWSKTTHTGVVAWGKPEAIAVVKRQGGVR